MSNDRSFRHYPKRKLVISKGFLFALARYSADHDVTKKRRLIGQNTILLTTLYQLLTLLRVRIGLPLALSEPEPTLPFGLSLSEPTNRHLPYLLIIMHVFSKQVTMKKKKSKLQ